MKTFIERSGTTFLLAVLFTLTTLAMPYSGLIATAEAQQGKNKHDAKIKLKKSSKSKKRDKDKDDDRGGNGIPKQIHKLNAKVSALQTQVENIELTPGPQGPAGEQVLPGLPLLLALPRGDSDSNGDLFAGICQADAQGEGINRQTPRSGGAGPGV